MTVVLAGPELSTRRGNTPVPRLGLISDPDFPEQVASRLSDSLPHDLQDQLGGEWSVEVLRDPVAAGLESGQKILQAAERQLEQQDWDYAVCVTDLPLRFDGRTVLADAGVDKCVGVISLPALGALQPYRRARQMVVQLLDEIVSSTAESREQQQSKRRRGLHSYLTELLAPIRRETPDRDEVSIRYRSTRRRGRIRLLSGMIRSNSPWRLVLGMSSALAAAVATGAFGLSSSTIWQISHRLDIFRQLGAMLASIALLVGWMIAAHHLWERPRHVLDKEQRRLYNTSTVLTLGVGVGCFYVGLFVINAAVAGFLVPSSLLTSTLGSPVTIGSYLSLAWGFTTMGVVAGALGSSLEDDATVRQAAYGYREAQRRQREQQHQEAEGPDQQ